jgi:hypothetical protein
MGVCAGLVGELLGQWRAAQGHLVPQSSFVIMNRETTQLFGVVGSVLGVQGGE